MSGKIPVSVVGQNINSVRNELVSVANSMPQYLATAKVADPQIYTMLTGNNDKYVFLPIVVAVVQFGAMKWGLNWDTDTCSAISGILVTLGLGIWKLLSPTVAKETQDAANTMAPNMVKNITDNLGQGPVVQKGTLL